MTLVHDLITLYILILLASALLSWFPTDSTHGSMATTKLILARLTEPVLRPIRSIMPRPSVGGVGIDLSVMIAIIIFALINANI